MQKIVQQQSVQSITAVSKALSELGFDLQLLGSERYVLAKLQSLRPRQISQLKKAFISTTHPRFKKEFAVSRHQPFGKTSDYAMCIKNADLTKLAKMVKLTAMLLQTKVYLFWKQSRISSVSISPRDSSD
jgi:hypothetical protein